MVLNQVFFLQEDDGNWSINQNQQHEFTYLNTFSIGWPDNFIDALILLKNYAYEHGNPVYFSELNENIIPYNTFNIPISINFSDYYVNLISIN